MPRVTCEVPARRSIPARKALVGVEMSAKPGPIALLLDAGASHLFRAPDAEESANPAGGHGATSARSTQTNSGRVMRNNDPRICYVSAA